MNKDLLLSEIFLQILYKVTNYKLYKDIQEQRSSELRKRNEKEASAQHGVECALKIMVIINRVKMIQQEMETKLMSIVNHYQSLKKCLHIERCFPVVAGGYQMIRLKQSEQAARQFHVCPNPKFVAETMPHRQYISLFQRLLPKNQQPNVIQKGLIYKYHNKYFTQLRKTDMLYGG